MIKIVKRISAVMLALVLGLTTGISVPGGENTMSTVSAANAGTFYPFGYTGNGQEFVAPASGTYSLECWGAKGSNHYSAGGGAGGYIYSQVNLKQGDKLYVVVGGAGNGLYNGGYNGGGNGISLGSDRVNASAGGGGTDIRTIAGDYNSRILSAGGGSGGYGRQQGSDSVFYNGSAALSGGTASGRLYKGVNAVASAGGGGGGWYGGNAGGGGANGYTPNGVQIVRNGKNALVNTVPGAGITKNGSEAMPTYSSATGSSYDSFTQTTYSTMRGNAGNGYAIITFLKPAVIELSDVTTVDSKSATFSTFVSEASEYTWYYFETDSNSEYFNDWRKIGTIASTETSEILVEKGGRNFGLSIVYNEAYGESMAVLNLEKTDRSKDDGLQVRCVAKGAEEIESSCNLKVLKNGYQEIVASYYKSVDAGTTINIDNVLVALLYESGTPAFASGWSNLYFVSTDESGTEVETKEVYVNYGDNTYRVRLKDENPEPVVDENGQPVLDGEGNPTFNDCTKETTFTTKGIDDKIPKFEAITLSEYELMNEDTETKPVEVTVTMNASDNFTLAEELVYALKPKDEAVNDSDFVKQAEIKLSISMNALYVAYVKDQAGNIGTQEVSIVVSDKEDPVIKSKSLVFKEAEGWVTKNIVQVEATDNYKTEQLQYRFTPPKEITYDLEDKNNTFGVWIPENNVIIQENGIYTIEVKDFVGNITTTTIDVKNVDATAPKITNVEIKTL